MIKKISISIIFLLVLSKFGYTLEYDGVYMSSPRKQSDPASVIVNQPAAQKTVSHKKFDTRNELIQEYIREIVIQELLDISSGIIKKIVTAQNMQIFPQLVYLSIQQVSLESFNQEVTNEILRSAYTEAFDGAAKDFDEGVNASVVQRGIKNKVRQKISPITENYVYQKIVEEILKQALREHHKIVVLQVAQRQAQLAAIQQRQEIIRQAVIKQYQMMVEAFLKESLMRSLQGGK